MYSVNRSFKMSLRGAIVATKQSPPKWQKLTTRVTILNRRLLRRAGFRYGREKHSPYSTTSPSRNDIKFSTCTSRINP